MKKLEQIQLNKLISRYGGVGSIIETNTNGSLIILPYDKWKCFDDRRLGQAIPVEDPRLLQYLNSVSGYEFVNRLVLIPTPDELSSKVYNANNAETNKTVSANFFPEWYFCTNPKCRRLMRYTAWETEWKKKFDNDDSFNKNQPACPFCSERRGENGGFRRRYLQQLRFVMASLETGEITDIPFGAFFGSNPEGGAWNVGRGGNPELTYNTLPSGDGLNAIYVKSQDGNRIYLSEIERNYIVKNGRAYRMIVKGSNSLYFPNIVRSLYIPTNGNVNTGNNLDAYEFDYLTNDQNYINNMIVKENLVVKRGVKYEGNRDNGVKYITRISAIERLKETSVLLSYTRMGKRGEDHQWYNCQTQQTATMKPKEVLPFDGPNPTTWMPIVEDYGEGILFEVSINSFTDSGDVTVFVHTFCHIIMKELEFNCGYPLASLKEKIYIDYDNKKAGFIIYTIAGSEGSYGGLISLVHNNKIEDLIVRGVERAKNCPNDPICINEPAAHCFACLDLPETSCVKFNDDLNRKYFLDRYFSDLASPQVGNTKPVEQPAETQNQVQKTGVQPVTQSTTDQTQDTRRRDIVL